MREFSRFARVAVATLVLALSVTGAAFAQAANNPVGLWRFQAFDDNTPALAALGTQDICFLANGTWFSTTFPNFNGHWFQKGNNAAGNGDRVRLLGNWADGTGNGSAEIDFVHLNLMTGAWNEWTDRFNSILWLRMHGTRVSNVCPPPATSSSASFDDTQQTPFGKK